MSSYGLQDCKIYGIDDLMRIDERTGGFYFSPGTMGFFQSRVSSDIWRNDDFSGYFVTSERQRAYCGPEYPRLYTVRSYRVVEGGDGCSVKIDTVGDFQGWETLASAKSAARSHWRNFAYVN